MLASASTSASAFASGFCARFVVALAASLSALLQPAVAAAEGNAIQDVTTTQQGGNLVVRIGLKTAPAAMPASFSVASPARIALDFLQTGNDSGKNLIDANQGDLRSINLVQAGDRTRLVMNLKRTVAFTSAIDGNAIVVTLTPPIADNTSGGSTGARAPTTRFAESTSNVAAHSIRDIDFRRGPDGTGRIVVDLSDTQTGVDIKTQGQSIVIDFLKSAFARQSASSPRCHRLRDAGADDQHVHAGRQRADGDRAARSLGAQRLPD